MHSQRLMLALVLPLAAFGGDSPATSSAEPVPTAHVVQVANGDSGKCPLRAAELDKLTPYRWQVAQYRADRAFLPGSGIRIDSCELIGVDDKGSMRTGLMVNIATGPNAAAFAKHWHAVCAESILPEARGKVQPVAGIPAGRQCVTADGSSSVYWIESPGRTIQLEPENEALAWGKILPQLLAVAAK